MSNHENSRNYAMTDVESVPEQRIRDRAYQIYKLRGAKDGHAEGDWLTAEAELKEIKKKAVELSRVVERLSV